MEDRFNTKGTKGSKWEFDRLSNQVIGVALEIHRDLGSGLFEEVYKVCLKHELCKNNLKVESEVPLPVNYKGTELELGYRIDLLVEDSLIVELKSVEHLGAMHKAQLLTYLKLANKRVGLLLNFGLPLFKDGIYRIVN
jgi:GxxExxY protein